MSENDSEDNYLRIKDLINEVIIRDLIVFVIIFLFILSQSWNNLFLLLFPILTFGFSLFFRIISTNKWRIKSEDITIEYNPLGSEIKNSNRLNACALIQLILLFWIGAESIYHPQLIESYSIYFIILLGLVYSFGYLWIFIDIWKYSKLSFKVKEKDEDDKVISFLSLNSFKLISILNTFLFILLNGLNILIVLFNSFNLVPHFDYFLPGTGIEGSEPIILPISLFIIFLASPLVAIFFLIKIYNEINNFNKHKLNKILDLVPVSLQTQIIENLKNFNKKFKNELKIE
ncbi:MAG: hypothetical protein ACFE8J_10645 [Candidatus Heimdallarchaeota archaeon]